jgi:D-alanyl-D-alanine carboxypeptidase-like protein/transglycosylase-like protein with SLT domain
VVRILPLPLQGALPPASGGVGTLRGLARPGGRRRLLGRWRRTRPDHDPDGQPPRRPNRRRRVIVFTLLAPFVLFAIFVGGFAATTSRPEETPSATAIADIPANYLQLYQEAAGAYGIDWAVLAGIGKVECDHGRSQLEGCNPPGTVNVAGARGPMQFLGSTWRAGQDTFALDVAGPATAAGSEAQGYATDGNGDGVADPWDPADAIHAAARYLRRSGAPADYSQAIRAYNHSDAYVAQVLRWAETYREQAAAGAPQAANVPGGPVTVTTVRGITVNSHIAPQLEAMLAAAEADGLHLTGGGFRSPEQQIALRRSHCGTTQYAIYEMPASQCSPPTARPGTSMHERGLAIDFENCSSHSTACWQWLNAHAASFGFHNLASEPWHWSIDGS